MTTMTVKDAAGATQTVAKVVATHDGTAVSTAAAPVAIAVDDLMVGARTETAPASDTASSGLNGRLQRIAQNLTTLITNMSASNSQLPATPSGAATVTITRPANTTAYSAGDVLGGALTIATSMTSAQRVMIASVDLMPQIAAIPAGMTSFDLHLYSATPPSAIADNGVFDLPSGDRSVYLGKFSVGTPADLGSTLYCQTDGVNRPVQMVGSASIFGYLVTVGGFTPAANSEVYQLRLHFLGL